MQLSEALILQHIWSLVHEYIEKKAYVWQTKQSNVQWNFWSTRVWSKQISQLQHWAKKAGKSIRWNWNAELHQKATRRFVHVLGSLLKWKGEKTLLLALVLYPKAVFNFIHSSNFCAQWGYLVEAGLHKACLHFYLWIAGPMPYLFPISFL